MVLHENNCKLINFAGKLKKHGKKKETITNIP